MSRMPSPPEAASSSQSQREFAQEDVSLGALTVVGGGVRSGKSRLALELALALGERRLFVATAQAFDDEMRERIAAHQRERGAQFETIEVPRRLGEVAATVPRCDVALLDCLTLYVSNLLLDAGDVEELPRGAAQSIEAATLDDVRRGVGALRVRAKHVVVVTNEVGMGVVPVSRLGRLFRDVAGQVNQWIAAEANRVWWCALGLPLQLKPSPLAVDPRRVAGNT